MRRVACGEQGSRRPVPADAIKCVTFCQFGATAPPPRNHELAFLCWPDANVFCAYARKHILGKAHELRVREALIELQGKDAVFARHLRLVPQVPLSGIERCLRTYLRGLWPKKVD
jgi:hypothetical protein